LTSQGEQDVVESITYEVGEPVTSKEAVEPGTVLYSEAGWYGRQGLVRYVGQDADGRHRLEVIQDNGDLSEAVVLGTIRVSDNRFTTNLNSGRYSSIRYTNESTATKAETPDIAQAPRIIEVQADVTGQQTQPEAATPATEPQVATEAEPETGAPQAIEQAPQRLAIERAPEPQTSSEPAPQPLEELQDIEPLVKVEPLSSEEIYERLEAADEKTGFVGDEVHVDGVPYRVYTKSPSGMVVLSPVNVTDDVSSAAPITLTREDLEKHIANGEVRVNTYLGTTEAGAIVADLREGERFFDTERGEMIELAALRGGSMVYKVLDAEGNVVLRSLFDRGNPQLYGIKVVEQRLADGRLVPVDRL
jgi:hypothetical protein